MEKYRLPYTNNRYYVTEGKICNSDGSVIPLEVVDGISYVRLVWYRGEGLYDAGMVVLLATDSISIPDHLLDSVISLYVDNNPRNITRGNLLYRFRNDRIPVEGHRGYYYIPFFTKYAINETGTVINVEWATYQENNIHAMRTGLNKSNQRPVKVLDFLTGEVTEFVNINAASVAYPAVDAKRIQYWLTNPPKYIPDCMLYFKDVSDESPWPDYKPGDARRINEFETIQIAAIDKKTGEKRVYPSILAASRATSISPPTITKYCRHRLSEGRIPYVFRYLADVESMPVGLNDA